MKRTWKILALCLALLMLFCFAAGCGGDNTDDPNTDDPVDPDNTPPDTDGETTQFVSTRDIDFLRGDFTMSETADGITVFSTPYDGSPHKLTQNNYEGSTEPEKTTLTFQYYKGDTLLATYDEDAVLIDGDEQYADGITEAGAYKVVLVFSRNGYREGTKSAQFVIAESYEIRYVVGAPTGAGVPQMTTSAWNPTHFATSDTGLTVKDPTMSSATRGYNFRGWYYDAACTQKLPVENGDSILDGPDAEPYVSSKVLTLYAKFEECVAYPPLFVDNTSTETGMITTEPTSIPAIPGYSSIPADAYKLVDMSRLAEGSTTAFRYGYSTLSKRNQAGDTLYSIAKDPAFQTEGNEYIIQWQDPSDLWDKQIFGLPAIDPDTNEPNVHKPGDGYFGAQMTLDGIGNTYNYSKYDTLEFWIYNANNNNNVITMLVFMNGNDTVSMYTDLTLDFSGWKKFTLHLSDFKSYSGKTANITKIHFYSCHVDPAFHTEKATLGDDTNPNFVYMSDIFLTNNETSYEPSGGNIPNASVLPTVLDNLGNIAVNAQLSDDEITALFEMLADNSETDLGTYWLDLDPSSPTGIKDTYERFMFLSEAYADPDSDYYRSATLREVIADGLNYMSNGAYTLINNKTPVSSVFEDVAYYIVKTVVRIYPYINAAHAENWMAPVFYFVSGPIGNGEQLIKTSYTYACASAIIGDPRGYTTGLRSIAAALENNRITMAMHAADISDAMTLFSAIYNTGFLAKDAVAPVISAFYNWFYDSVDVFLTNGVENAAIKSAFADYVTLETYIRGLLIVYDMAPADVQAKFAAAVKYYIAQNADLDDGLAHNARYHKETTALTALKANSAAAANPNTDTYVVRLFENIGQVYVKDASNFILIDREGTVLGNAAISSLENCETFYTFQMKDVVAIMADDRVIFISGTSVVEETTFNGTDTVSYTNGTTTITITNAAAVQISGAAAGTVKETAGAPVIVGTTTEDGKLLFKFYNYTETSAEISIVLNGAYTPEDYNDVLYAISPVSGMTRIVLDLKLISKEGPGHTAEQPKINTTRQFTDSIFELVLTPTN